jgi:putative acetyltransferase
MGPEPIIRPAAGPEDIDRVRLLLREYRDLISAALPFQPFDRELEGLPGEYAPPPGRLVLATVGDEPAGCIGLRPRGGGDSEMKRLYVRPACRGLGLGRLLAERIIAEARALGYRRVLLDTLSEMAGAHRLYLALGFAEIPPYMDRPIPGARFFALDLDAG